MQEGQLSQAGRSAGQAQLTEAQSVPILPAHSQEAVQSPRISDDPVQGDQVTSTSFATSGGVAMSQVSQTPDAMGESVPHVLSRSPPPWPNETKYSFHGPLGFTCTWAVRIHVEWPYGYVWLYLSPHEGSWVWILAHMQHRSQAQDGDGNEWEDDFDSILEWFRQDSYLASWVPLNDEHSRDFGTAIREVVRRHATIVRARPF
jgi:hypothetical protein